MANLKLQRMDSQEFLVWQMKQDKRYELVDGLPWLPVKMMTGATIRHDMVTMNILASLHRQLRNKPCNAHTADIAVQIPAGNIRRPDMLVDCGNPDFRDMMADKPFLVVEIFSPSTLKMDRFHKLEEYKTVPSMRAILLVMTESAEVTLYTCSSEKEKWRRDIFTDMETVLDFGRIKASLSLEELYEGILPAKD